MAKVNAQEKVALMVRNSSARNLGAIGAALVAASNQTLANSGVKK